MFINGREKGGTEIHKQLCDVYENLEDYNATKKRKVLIVFDDMVTDMPSNKKLSPIVT